MSHDASSVSRFDLDRLTGWLLSAAPGSVTWAGPDWLTVLDAMSTDIYSAAADGREHDWRRISRAYLIALGKVAETGWADRPVEPVIYQLNLTAVLTARLPVDRDAELLAPERAAALFFGSLLFDPVEARRIAERDRRSVPLPDLMRLRWTAQMIRPMVRLKPLLPDEAVERLKPWEDLLPRLP